MRIQGLAYLSYSSPYLGLGRSGLFAVGFGQPDYFGQCLAAALRCYVWGFADAYFKKYGAQDRLAIVGRPLVCDLLVWRRSPCLGSLCGL